MFESGLMLRGAYRCTCCHAAEYNGGRPAVWIGHGAPGGCALGATGLLPPGVVFAICPGDGEATPVRCPAGGDAFDASETAGVEAAGAVAGELPGDGEATAGGEAAAPCAPAAPAGLAAPAGDGDSSAAGARAPMFARSWPIRIFPRNTGRSKM